MRANPSLALIGPPNAGKTTLYNWLTGSKFKTVNYPGATVDCHEGLTHPKYGDSLKVVDTPGIYSLAPKSLDEWATYKILFAEDTRTRMAITVVDATQLERHLLMPLILKKTGLPQVIALTMTDLMKRSGKKVDLEKLSARLGIPVVGVEGRHGQGVVALLEKTKSIFNSIKRTDFTPPRPLTEKELHVLHGEAALIALDCVDVYEKSPTEDIFAQTRKIDHFLLHPVFGVIAFFLIMGTLFSSIFWLAAPMMDTLDQSVNWLSGQVSTYGPDSFVTDFIANGVILSAGAVLVFIPQIFILFLGISWIEDSGYLARAATLIDRPLSWMGLSGRAFVPLLSGFACAVPAMMAARNIQSARERWIAVFILPLMTCSARLPVYALFLTFIFQGAAAWKAGLSLAGLYLLSLILGALSAGVLNRMLAKTKRSHFMMELPLYRRPRLRFTIQSSWVKTKSFALKAGPVIFSLALIIWGLSHFPRAEGGVPPTLAQSYLGKTGQLIEPVFEPMGADWRVGVGLLSAFVAREVFVSSMALVMNLSNEMDDDAAQASLIEKMHEAKKSNGEPLFTVASVLAILVYFMIALQCLSTTATASREMGSWRFAAAQVIALNIVAYIAAVLVYQVASSFV